MDKIIADLLRELDINKRIEIRYRLPMDGVWTELNQDRAFQRYKRNATLDGWASYKTGICYLEGKGTERNYSSAHRYLLWAANNGVGEAVLRLGDMYMKGYCHATEQDEETALSLYNAVFEKTEGYEENEYMKRLHTDAEVRLNRFYYQKYKSVIERVGMAETIK
ncbi:Sel1 repeat-containing protein [Lachnospiraceae bacterium YSD2013]|nr:Sel1 repeat-containing protein [Lachnospiraceae bacterium YSD2013]